MKKIDTIVVAPHFYTMEGAGVGYHSDAAMAVDGGKILKVGNRAEILAEYTADYLGSSYGAAWFYRRPYAYCMQYYARIGPRHQQLDDVRPPAL